MMCEVSRCKRPTLLVFAAFHFDEHLEVDICEYHWEKHCDDDDKFDLEEYFRSSKRKVRKK